MSITLNRTLDALPRNLTEQGMLTNGFFCRFVAPSITGCIRLALSRHHNLQKTFR